MSPNILDAGFPLSLSTNGVENTIFSQLKGIPGKASITVDFRVKQSTGADSLWSSTSN